MQQVDVEHVTSAFCDLLWNQTIKINKFAVNTLIFRCKECLALKFPILERALMLGSDEDTLATSDILSRILFFSSLLLFLFSLFTFLLFFTHLSLTGARGSAFSRSGIRK